MADSGNFFRKVIFVDVDGVLSAPEFNGYGIGMPENTWFWYCVVHGDDSYKDCKSVPCVARHLRKERSTSAIYVLTAVNSTFEAEAKKKFIEKNYEKDLFDGFIAVGKSEDKVRMILAMAKKFNLSPDECELIDDDYNLLLQATCQKIKARHISNLAEVQPGGE